MNLFNRDFMDCNEQSGLSIPLMTFPKQVSYKRSDGQMESLPLEYMNPPISEEEMRKNMLIPMFEKR